MSKGSLKPLAYAGLALAPFSGGASLLLAAPAAIDAVMPKPPEFPKPNDTSIDEAAVAARQREVSRARGAGRQFNVLTKLGGASTGGFGVARSSASATGGSSLG